MNSTIRRVLLAVLAATMLSGCVTSHYSKTITVRRDGAGKILEIIEVEHVGTPHQSGNGIDFEYIPGVQTGNAKARKPY